jgi:hypothetical protein
VLKMKIKSGARRATTTLLIACLALPQALWAQGGAVDEDPNPYAMVGDLFVARPLGVVLTLAGTAVWVVSLPFTLMAGHANEAADTLMLGPAEATFVRCLGCRNTGYTGRDMDEADQRREARAARRAEAEAAEAAESASE